MAGNAEHADDTDASFRAHEVAHVLGEPPRSVADMTREEFYALPKRPRPKHVWPSQFEQFSGLILLPALDIFAIDVPK